MPPCRPSTCAAQVRRRTIRRALDLLSSARTQTGRRRTRAIQRARAAIGGLARRVTKAAKGKRPLPLPCAAELSAMLERLLVVIPPA
jgi:hypothetical protein